MYHKLSRSTSQKSRSQLDITYEHQKRYDSGTDKLSKVKLGENYPRVIFKVIGSNTDIAITPPRIVQKIGFKFGTEFHHVTDDTLQMFKVKGQRSRSQRKVMYQQQKRYNTATDRFRDLKLGMAS